MFLLIKVCKIFPFLKIECLLVLCNNNFPYIFIFSQIPSIILHGCFLVLQGKKEIARIEGADAPNLTKTIQHHATAYVAPVINERTEQPAEVCDQHFMNSIEF